MNLLTASAISDINDTTPIILFFLNHTLLNYLYITEYRVNVKYMLQPLAKYNQFFVRSLYKSYHCHFLGYLSLESKEGR